MNLDEAKSKIFLTECKNCIISGMSCSEPILTLGPEGIIDNYFVFSINTSTKIIKKPKIVFGVYSDIEKAAYINTKNDIDDLQYQLKQTYSEDELINAYKKYEELYPIIRNIIYKPCKETDKKTIQEYVSVFKTISGEVFWNFYKVIAPQFFQWLTDEEIDYTI